MQLQPLSKYFLLAFAVFISANALQAQPGTLDPAFGTGGKVISINQNTGIQGLVIQPDGKLVGAGYYGNQWMLTRYNSNGTLDSSFALNGIDTAGIANESGSTANGIALQSNGKIVTAGNNFNPQTFAEQFFVVRNNTNGSLDNSFGTNGQVIVPNIINGALANCVAVQHDGKILAGGFQIDNNGIQKFMLLRLNTDGTFDPSFGTNGIATTSIQSFGDVINTLAIQADGKIVAAGYSLSNTDGSVTFALARYNTNGVLDASFGKNGIDTLYYLGSTFSKIQSILVQHDGKILVCGFTSFATGPHNYYFALARYTANGILDNSFDIMKTSVYGNCMAFSMALQSDGKILVAGEEQTTNPFIQNFAMVRYLQGGLLDSTFGVNGLDTTNFGNQNSPQANTIQLINSRIYLAGTTGNSLAIAAYKNDAGALPVTLLNFDGVLLNNEARLIWTTANESNNKGFEVQKSIDAQTFTNIGFVGGHGNSSKVNNYDFTDVKVVSGSNYYRLQQIDLDGRFTYSSVIKLDYSRFDWAVLSNPGSGYSWLQLQLDKKANVKVQIISITGSIIQTINKGNMTAGTYSFPLNMSNLTLGIYIVRLEVNDQSYSKKIVR